MISGNNRNSSIAREFERVYEEGKNLTELAFLQKLNEIVIMVAKDDSFSTNEKLKIYELLSQICNCLPQERPKYASKLLSKLR